jgi:hypothetical protein
VRGFLDAHKGEDESEKEGAKGVLTSEMIIEKSP